MRLRDRSFGQRVFRELADFIAHPQEKDRGPTFEVVRDLVTSVRWMTENLKASESRNVARADFCDALNAAYRLGAGHVAARKLGVSIGTVESSLGRICKKVGDIRDNRVIWHKPPTHREVEVTRELSGLLSVNPAFTCESLAKAFFTVLSKNKLIDENSVEELYNLREYLALFAVVHMHASWIKLQTGEKFQIYLSRSEQISVWIDITHGYSESIITVPVFTSTLALSEYFIIEDDINWQEVKSMPLEIGPDRRLRLVN